MCVCVCVCVCADYVSVAEGDSMHFNTGNRDALEYAASELAYFVDYGPPGSADTVGLGTLSTRPFSGETRYVKLPKPHNDTDQLALNRYMVVSKHDIDGVEVTVGGVHLEWFGDPSAQTEFVADYFRQHVDGPAILIGDFILEPPGNRYVCLQVCVCVCVCVCVGVCVCVCVWVRTAASHIAHRGLFHAAFPTASLAGRTAAPTTSLRWHLRTVRSAGLMWGHC